MDATLELLKGRRSFCRLNPDYGKPAGPLPCTKEEIFDFCMEERLNVDIDYLYDYYSSKGWKIGSSSMKDWKAAVRNWARRDKKGPVQSQAPAKKVTAQEYTQRDYSQEDEDAMRRMLAAAGWGT